jgi:hypothetical protein
MHIRKSVALFQLNLMLRIVLIFPGFTPPPTSPTFLLQLGVHNVEVIISELLSVS